MQQLQQGVEAWQVINCFLCMQIKYRKYNIKPDVPKDSTISLYAHTKCITALPSIYIEEEVDEAFKHLMIYVMKFTEKEGSNFVINFVIKLDLNMATYTNL